MADNNKQTDIIEVNKFGNWNYSWWNSLNLRMPWYNINEKSTKALLTTSVDVDYYPSGSIIWGHDDRQPADWISQVGMQNPGVIWYWVNEDDCDTNRQPGTVHCRYSGKNDSVTVDGSCFARKLQEYLLL